MKKIFSFSLWIILCTSCVDDRPLKTHSFNDIVTMEMPMEMVAVESGILGASSNLLRGNKDFDVEVGMFYEKKTDLVTFGVPFTTQEMFDLELERFFNVLTDVKKDEAKAMRIDYMEGLSGYISGNWNDQPYLIYVVVCETPFYYLKYYVAASEKNFKKHKSIIQHMIESVEEYRDFEAKDGNM